MKAKFVRSSLAVAVALTCSTAVYAESVPTVYLGSYGGSTEQTFRQKIIPAYEATAHKVKVVYVAGNSTDTLAKLQAQKGRQEMDLVIMDDGPMQQAVKFGFCDKIKDAPGYKDLYPLARIDDHSVGIAVVATGLVYNTEAFKKAGLPKPDSWKALTDSKLKEKVSVGPISTSYGLHTLLMFAKMNGGSETNIDPGFNAIIKQVAPNVLSWEPSAGKVAESFQNGDVIIGSWGSGRTAALKSTGFPVEFVYPKEGAIALQIAACPVAKTAGSAAGQELLQFLMTPQVQAWLAASEGWGPTNRKVTLDPAIAAKVPYGPEQVNKLVSVNWNVVNEKRTEWTNRWNRTVER